jgi:hypothetical protein
VRGNGRDTALNRLARDAYQWDAYERTSFGHQLSNRCRWAGLDFAPHRHLLRVTTSTHIQSSRPGSQQSGPHPGWSSWAEGEVNNANDDKSPLIDLLTCIVCKVTMKIAISTPESSGGDLVQYRCEQCGRIELVRLIRRSRDEPA